MAREKEYTGSFTLGATTPTYDLESEPDNIKPFDHLTEEEIKTATNQFNDMLSVMNRFKIFLN